MKVEDLLFISPSELAALSDAELSLKLEPLIPQSRAPYIGPRTQTVAVGAVRVPKHIYAKKQAMMDAVLAQLQEQMKEQK